MAKRAKEESSGSGHNAFASTQLRSLIERIERLEAEKTHLTADIREVYSEAKGLGFDTKIMRQVIRLRKLDKADRQEQEAILDLYKSALGMLDGTPLGDAALNRLMKEQTGQDEAGASAHV